MSLINSFQLNIWANHNFLITGETGGPVVCQRCNTCDWYVAGIMAFGDLCPQNVNSYAAYTSVESYEQWISQHTGVTVSNDGTCASNRVGTYRYFVKFQICNWHL